MTVATFAIWCVLELPETGEDQHAVIRKEFCFWLRDNEALVAEKEDAVEARLSKLEEAAAGTKKN